LFRTAISFNLLICNLEGNEACGARRVLRKAAESIIIIIIIITNR